MLGSIQLLQFPTLAKLNACNGQLAGGDTFTTLNTNPQLAYIGKAWTNAYFNGIVDEVSIYNRALSDTEIATLAGIDTVPPVFSGISLATDDNSNGKINLSWSPAIDSSSPITYNIIIPLFPGQNFAVPNATTTNTSYQVNNLTNNQTYYFVVRAQDAQGNEETNAVELSTAPTKELMPPVFSGLSSAVDTQGGGTVNLTWNPATDSSSPITYNIYYSTVSQGQNFAVPNISTTNTSYSVSGLVDNQEYFFTVRAKDSAGNEETNTVELSLFQPQM